MRLGPHFARSALLVGTGALFFWLSAPISSVRAAVDLSTWVTDGMVNAVLPDGGTLYVGGAFQRVGPVTGCGVPISASTLARVPGFPRVTGEIYAVAPDGAGGWYLGGSFSYVGGFSRTGLAHVTAALTVDNWDPFQDGWVLDLVVTPTDVVVCGTFLHINSAMRPYLARISRSTGQATAWTPSPNAQVSALASDGTTLYAAGRFAQIGPTVRMGLAAFTLATDALTSWDPGASAPAPPVIVNDIALANGYVYAGGNFIHIGGQNWPFAAALRPDDATATSWHLAGGPDNAVTRVLPIGDRVILGGSFNSIAGAGFRGLAAVDTATGALFAQWKPQPSSPAGSIVQILALESLGSRIAVGGSFSGISGTASFDFAVLDTAAGAAASAAPLPLSVVRTLVRQGGELFVGGSFASLGVVPRRNLAAFDVVSGAVQPWAPDALSPQPEPFGGRGSVGALAVDSTRVFAAVTFVDVLVGGLPRSQVRAFSRANAGTVWQVDCDQVVNALARRAGRVFAGGGFTFLGGARANLGALDAVNGTLQPWAPDPDNTVRALIASPGALVLGGDFVNVSGQPRARLAQVDYASGSPTPWAPGADGAISALASTGSTLYAGGDFANAGGQPRARVVALDLGANGALPWNPGADATVRALASDGVNVYAGGTFTHFAGQLAPVFAGVTAAGGSPLGWSDTPSLPVNALALANGRVVLGGQFTAVDAEPVSGLAAVFDPVLLSAPTPSMLPSLRLSVGPSPLRGVGHVSFSLERDATVWLRVLDVTGRVARTLVAGERRAAGPQQVALDGAGLAPGVYHVQLALDGGRTAARFIVLP